MLYILGLFALAFGITLNTKTGLGVSPIISVAYSISSIWSLNFGNVTFLLYSIFVIVEIILHTVQKRGSSFSQIGSAILKDALQLPLSLIFTRFLNIFSAILPELATDCEGTFAGTFAGRIVFLCIAIIFTGIGAALSLDMRIIPNPGDGIVQAIADTVHRPIGLTKNCFDLLNITFTIAISFFFMGHLVGIGIGTVFAVIGVGRVIAVFHHFFLNKILTSAGLA
jgi:uncharacterized membrane protein YczE